MGVLHEVDGRTHVHVERSVSLHVVTVGVGLRKPFIQANLDEVGHRQYLFFRRNEAVMEIGTDDDTRHITT